MFNIVKEFRHFLNTEEASINNYDFNTTIWRAEEYPTWNKKTEG